MAALQLRQSKKSLCRPRWWNITAPGVCERKAEVEGVVDQIVSGALARLHEASTSAERHVTLSMYDDILSSEKCHRVV